MTKHHTQPAAPAPKHSEGRDESELSLERLVLFSDAVMAIAITLLALDIRLPATEGASTNALLLDLLLAVWPKILGYIISFLVIGVYWLGHNRQFRNLRRYDSRLVWLNLIFLLLIAFLPFPTSIVSEYSNATATILYAGTVALIGLTMALMWWYAHSRPELWRHPLTPAHFRSGLIRQLVPPAVFILSIGLAFWNSSLARYFWVMTAASFFVRVDD